MKSNCCQSKIHIEQDRYFCPKCLQYCTTNIKYYNLFIYSIIFIICTVISTKLVNGNVTKSKLKLIDTTDIVLNKDSIFNQLVKEKILFPELVIKQVILETGNLQSKIVKENKNLFGIKYIKQKLAVCKLNGHAKYKSYKDCIKDYKRVQGYYLTNIEGKYAEDSNYKQKLLTIK
jgi:hypothetical protein